MIENSNQSSNEEDNLAMAALAAGDDDALAAIIKRWQGPITSFLYRTVGEYDTALDLSQEVFVRLYRNRRAYKTGGKFSSYLFMIASNLAKNHFRWKSRHPECHLDSEWGKGVAGDGVSHVDPGAHLERSEKGVQLQQALLSVPEKLRIPVILFYYEDYSHTEIAKILKCSRKSVETRIYRARQILKPLIEAIE
ncbi:MAG: RNA polymerase sigma factor [Verrucomicrobiales bacterium]|nr:RNA polymerase sigma factor [Verrucomicrobiales bacterium]